MPSRPACPSSNSAPRRWRGSKGFALVATIWTVGLLTLLGTAAIVGARYRTVEVSTYAATTRISLAAESAINLTIAFLLQEPDSIAAIAANFPLRCQLPGGESASITIEDEAGKIDLNTARPQLLTLLFARLSGRADEAARVTNRIVRFRESGKPPTLNSTPNLLLSTSSPAAPAGQLHSLPDRPVEAAGQFLSVAQLDQIASLSPAIFHAARPFLTVRSRRTEPLPAVAPERLRRLLSLTNSPPSSTPQGGGSTILTIRADVASRDGARFIREALVSFIGGTRPFKIHEWLRGDIDASLEPVHKMPAQLRKCFEVSGS